MEGRKLQKVRFTLGLATNVDGSDLVKPLIIRTANNLGHLAKCATLKASVTTFPTLKGLDECQGGTLKRSVSCHAIEAAGIE